MPEWGGGMVEGGGGLTGKGEEGRARTCECGFICSCVHARTQEHNHDSSV